MYVLRAIFGCASSDADHFYDRDVIGMTRRLDATGATVAPRGAGQAPLLKWRAYVGVKWRGGWKKPAGSRGEAGANRKPMTLTVFMYRDMISSSMSSIFGR